MAKEMSPSEKKKAERKARNEALQAEWKVKENTWQPLVEEHFCFLQAKYGFGTSKLDKSSNWQLRVIFKNATTGVYVDRSIEFNRVEMTLIRLDEGKIPQYSSEWFVLFDNLLEVRAPQLLPIMPVLSGLEEKQINATLAFLSHTLEEYGADILQGDFLIIEAIEKLIQKRKLKMM